MKRVAIARRTRIKPRSDKMAEKYVARRALVSRLLADRPRCEFEWKCGQQAVQVHEVQTRARGGDILDIENCRALCAEHHRWIYDHPAEATAGGWLVSRWPKPAG